MKNFLTVSATTFLFSSVLWVIWAFFLLQGDDNFKALGPLLYYPHAARVLCVVYFGYRAIPALFLAEIWGPLLFFPESFSFYPYIPSIISVMCSVNGGRPHGKFLELDTISGDISSAKQQHSTIQYLGSGPKVTTLRI